MGPFRASAGRLDTRDEPGRAGHEGRGRGPMRRWIAIVVALACALVVAAPGRRPMARPALGWARHWTLARAGTARHPPGHPPAVPHRRLRRRRRRDGYAVETSAGLVPLDIDGPAPGGPERRPGPGPRDVERRRRDPGRRWPATRRSLVRLSASAATPDHAPSSAPTVSRSTWPTALRSPPRQQERRRHPVRLQRRREPALHAGDRDARSRSATATRSRTTSRRSRAARSP